MTRTTKRVPTLKVWGCRGSIPVSGGEFARYGGATTCFAVESDEGRLLIDAGSGLQAFGSRSGLSPRDATLFVSHFHSDHIVGFPFYRHLFQEGWSLELAAVPREGLSMLDAMTSAHRRPFFPVPLQDSIRAELRSLSLDARGELERAGLRVRWMEVEHPGGASAFRIEGANKSVVIATDIELRRQEREALLEFAKGATYAFLDAQYADDEYPKFEGWGHSTAEDCARFAQEAQIGTLYLTHHDPSRTDAGVDALLARAQAIYPQTLAAFEGLELTLD